MMLSAKGKQGNHKSPDLTHFTISKHIKLGLRVLEGLRSSACSGAVCGHWSANGLLCPFSKWHDESINRVYCRTWTIWYHHKKKEFYVFNPIRSQGEKPSLTFDKILWFENVCWGRLLLFSLADRMLTTHHVAIINLLQGWEMLSDNDMCSFPGSQESWHGDICQHAAQTLIGWLLSDKWNNNYFLQLCD